MSNPIAKKRLDAFHKQGGRCYYCKSLMWLKNRKKFAKKHTVSKSEAKRFQCTAEHLTARSDGGTNEASNIVAACLFCNHTRHQKKRPRGFSEHRDFIQNRMKQGKWHPRLLHHLCAG